MGTEGPPVGSGQGPARAAGSTPAAGVQEAAGPRVSLIHVSLSRSLHSSLSKKNQHKHLKDKAKRNTNTSVRRTPTPARSGRRHLSLIPRSRSRPRGPLAPQGSPRTWPRLLQPSFPARKSRGVARVPGISSVPGCSPALSCSWRTRSVPWTCWVTRWVTRWVRTIVVTSHSPRTRGGVSLCRSEVPRAGGMDTVFTFSPLGFGEEATPAEDLQQF